MKYINNTLIILCILFISCNIKITGNHLSYMKFRNYVLRTLMSKEYIDFKGVTKYEFCKKLGFSNKFLDIFLINN